MPHGEDLPLLRDDVLTRAIVTVVVAAVIEENGRFLLTRRLKGTHLEGLWEFPGGKIGDGETHERGLMRELREELDVDVDVGGLVFETEHAYPDRSISLHFYRCTLRGAPRPMLRQEMRWVSPDELARLAFPPADRDLIRQLTAPDTR